MFRPTLFASLAFLPIFLAPTPAVAPLVVPPCPNTIRHEPLVLYDVTGSTIGGAIDIGLTVYNDGTARLSSTGQFGQASKAETVFVGPDAALQLLLDLSALGVGHLCDNFADVPDLPTSTLTIFRDAVDARNHTVSWVEGLAPFDAVQLRLHDFIQKTFPNF
jgi:hypothetical protein